MQKNDVTKVVKKVTPTLLKPADMIRLVRKESPKLLAQVPDKRAAALVRAALNQLGKRIKAVEDGVVKVPGFGNFRMRQIEREKDGKKVTVTRTIFRAAKPGPKGARLAGRQQALK